MTDTLTSAGWSFVGDHGGYVIEDENGTMIGMFESLADADSYVVLRQRAEAAETALAAEFVYAIDLVNRYGEDMRRRGTKGQPSIEFTHWKAANE